MTEKKVHYTVAQAVYGHHIGEQGYRAVEFFPKREAAVEYLIDLVNHEPHVWPEGMCRDDNTGEIFFKYEATLDPEGKSGCCRVAVYVVGPGAYRCSGCGDLILARDLIEPELTDRYLRSRGESDPVADVYRHYKNARGEYCECSICTLGPDEYIRNFLPSEY